MDHPAVPDDDVSSLAAGLLLANAKIATLEQALHQGHSLIQQTLQEQQSTFQKEIQNVRKVVVSLAKDTAATIAASSSAIARRIDHVEQLQQQRTRALEERMSALEELIRTVDRQNQQRIETLRERQQILFLRLVIIQVVLVSIWGILLLLLTK